MATFHPSPALQYALGRDAVRGRLGNDVVLRVRAPAPDFWRGQSFDVWDGRVWTRSEHIDDVENARQPIEPPVDVQRFKQHVQVEASAIGVLYGAYRPLFANLPPTSYVRMADGAMRLSHPLGRGTQYTMVSLRPVVTEAELRTHDPRGPGADAPTALAPRSGRAASPRVARLAARITAGAPTTYDAIRALERWPDIFLAASDDGLVFRVVQFDLAAEDDEGR